MLLPLKREKKHYYYNSPKQNTHKSKNNNNINEPLPYNTEGEAIGQLF